ncbi:MAG: hypothetical protein M0Z28_10870 [Rhodospirillales bacterium]|nr:hypothetical protein [Rhodospirillales bacterium]
MNVRHTLAVAVVLAGIGGLIVPTLAQTAEGKSDAPNQPGQTSREDHGMMGGGMMGGMMGGGMMGGGPSGMMQSMNGMMQSMNAMMQTMGGMMQSMGGGDGRPNSQWQPHPPGNAAPN